MISAVFDPKTDINCATRFENLGDSLEAVEIILAIEDEFGINIPDEIAETISTVGDALIVLSRDFGFHD